MPHSGSHGTRGTGAANTLSHRPITLHGPLRNIQKCTPHLHLKRRTLQMQGDALPAATENTQRLLVKRMLALMQLRIRVFGAQILKSRIRVIGEGHMTYAFIRFAAISTVPKGDAA